MDRGNINANIVGGVPNQYAGHHLIGVAVAKLFPVMHKAASVGYNINRGSNGIALPRQIAESLKTGLPLHNGSHLGQAVEYTTGLLKRLQAQYDRGLLADKELGAAIGRIEDDIRAALLGGKIKLQSADPRP